MKTLNTYINEWKVSQDSVLSIDKEEFVQIEPDKNGACLLLVFLKRFERISLYILNYELNNKRIICENGNVYDKNKKGYYVWGEEDNSMNVHIVLFKNEAIKFLNDLIENQDQIIHITKFKDVLVEPLMNYRDKYIVAYSETSRIGEKYSHEELEKMINQIKGNK